MENLYQWTWSHEIVYTVRSPKDEQLLKTISVLKKQKYEGGGQFKVKNHDLFYGGKTWTVELRQSVTEEDYVLPVKFIWIIFWQSS